MAGGPLLPISAFPGDTTGRLYPFYYNGAGANASPRDGGFGVKASLDADSTWMFRYAVPAGAVPTGVLKLRVLALANATSGVANFQVKDGTCPAGTSPSGVTMTSEAGSSITWAAGDNDKYKEVKVTLTAAPAANDMLVIAITFQTSGWTLAQQACFIPTIIWE